MSSFSEVLEALRRKKQFSKQNLATKAGLTTSYISHLTLGSREKPSEEVVIKLAKALELDNEEKKLLFDAAGLPLSSISTGPFISSIPLSQIPIDKLVGEIGNEDWGDAPNIQAFYGRVAELEKLTHWILRDRCQMVLVAGSGGIGKTMLTAKFARDNAGEFEYVFWRSLKDAPSFESLLRECILLFSNQKQRDLPSNIEDHIRLLIAYLKANRCLLILDNMEAILREQDHAGDYREDYEEYGRLIEMIGKALHQSCLLLTSREIPKEIAVLEGETGPVRVLALKGLKTEDGLKILGDKKLDWAIQTEDAAALVQRYTGNPLALKVAAEYIREIFDGNIHAFLEEKSLIFKNIQDVLEQQFVRLNPLELQIMYWLTIEREAIALKNLQSEVVPPPTNSELIEALDSLRRRDLIERKEIAYTLPPVILEYMTAKLITQVVEEIKSGSIELFESHPLMKAQTKDYIRDAQIRFILDPIAQQLLNMYGREKCEEKLKAILSILREAPRPGYAAANILHLLIRLGYDLNGYDFSHLYVRQAYLQAVWLNHVNFSYANLKQTVFTDTVTSILSVSLSPDDRLFAAGTENGEVRLWAADSGAPLRIYQGHSGRVRSVAFSPNSQKVVSGSEDHTLRIWDTTTDQCLHILEGHTDRVRAVAISPDGNTIISGSDDYTVRVWDMHTGSALSVLQGHTNHVRTVAFSPDGRTIANGGEDYIIHLWDIQSGQSLKILEGHEKQVHTVNFSLDGKLLASGGEDQIIRLWSVRSGQCLKVLEGHENQVRSVAFSPDGTTVASASDDQTIRLWDVQSGQCLKVLEGHLHRVYTVNFNRQGTTLISGSEDQTVRFWDIRSGLGLKTLQGYINQVRSVAFNPAGTLLVSGGDDRQLRLWNAQTGQYIRTLQGHTNGVRGVAFSPDGEKIASASDDRTVRLWNVQSGKSLKVLREHTDRVRTIAFSFDGGVLASGGEDHTVRIWDTKTGQRLKILWGHTDWVRSVAFSVDGKSLASGSEDWSIRIWNAQTGDRLKVLKEHEDGVRCVAFSPDGSTLASSSDDETIRLWNTTSWEQCKTLGEPKGAGWILSVAFSPDGSLLASGGEDQNVRIWDIKTGACQKTMEGHKHRVYSVAFHPGGRILASGSLDGTIRLWDVETGAPINTLKYNKPYEGMNISHVQGLTETQQKILMDLGAVMEEE